jgi:pimeloyl-ACP methyl ester carboxylesterase
VHQLFTLAVPHLRVAAPRWWWPAQLNRSWYMAALQPRGRGESRLLRDDLALVDRLWRDWSPNYRCPADHMRRVKNAIRERASEVIGYYRELPRGLSRPASKLLLRTTTVPAMYLHGQDDGCVGVSLCRGVERAYRAGVRLRVVRDAGHFLHLERPAEVNREILAFFDAG